ncbi:hypothetical protein CDL15_Pgr011297 [Punica granatum]|uniref:Uncharacterized protein n=1 Tax=Punica granatum TaxID=22663 RepID=A0A218WFP3_PUNGR|nr:hypothetical protein CDL15_Pgr011297 [Punica granatum]
MTPMGGDGRDRGPTRRNLENLQLGNSPDFREWGLDSHPSTWLRASVPSRGWEGEVASSGRWAIGTPTLSPIKALLF